jgi:hypothetical protein
LTHQDNTAPLLIVWAQAKRSVTTTSRLDGKSRTYIEGLVEDEIAVRLGVREILSPCISASLTISDLIRCWGVVTEFIGAVRVNRARLIVGWKLDLSTVQVHIHDVFKVRKQQTA